jgi:aryl-alcohol dehydrogenase-like predicted oxidoreductase
MTSLDEFKKHLDYFQSKGYNEVDTARTYVGGAQEAWTRDAKWKDRGLTLATKVYPTEPGTHKPDKLKELFTTSLKELETDAVDIFYLHAPDHSTPFEETLGAVNELHKQGKFVQLGLSNFAAWEVAEVYNICKERGWVKPTIYQAMYNAISKLILHSSKFLRLRTDNVCQPALSSLNLSHAAKNTRLISSSTTPLQVGFSAARSNQQTLPLKKVVLRKTQNWATCTATATSRTPISKHSNSLKV